MAVFGFNPRDRMQLPFRRPAECQTLMPLLGGAKLARRLLLACATASLPRRQAWGVAEALPTCLLSVAAAAATPMSSALGDVIEEISWARQRRSSVVAMPAAWQEIPCGADRYGGRRVWPWWPPGAKDFDAAFSAAYSGPEQVR